MVTERIAEMMIRCSLATGHGDTVVDLLAELEAQIKELQSRAEIAERRHPNPADYRYWEGRYRDEAERAEKAEAELSSVRELAEGFWRSAAKAEAELAETQKLLALLDAELAQARNAALEEAADHVLVWYRDYVWRHQVAATIRGLKGEPK